jgi:hypothetical protein
MEKIEQTTGAYFGMLTTLHLAMLMGQVIFALVVWYLVSSGQVAAENSQLNDVFRLLVPLVIVGGLIGSRYMARARLRAIAVQSSLKDKLAAYRTLFVIKLAMLEAPALLAIVACLITGHDLYLALAGLVILIFFISRPTKYKVGSDLKLTREEMTMMNDPATSLSSMK